MPAGKIKFPNLPKLLTIPEKPIFSDNLAIVFNYNIITLNFDGIGRHP